MNFLPLAVEKLTTSESIGVSGLGFVIVLIVLAVLALFVMLLSRIINGKQEKPVKENTEEVTKKTPPPVEDAPQTDVTVTETVTEITVDPADEIPHIPGFVVLDGVSEQDAAVLMAITAHQTGIDLARLDFKSIKRLNQDPVLENIEEQDAAAIMAIVSDKTGIPLDRLIFNSIKLAED